MTDERLDFLLEGRERLSRPIGEIVDELHDLSSAATAGSRVLSRLEAQADDAGDELRSVASQAGVATTAVAGLNTTLSRLDDVQVDVDVDSSPALDLDTTRRVALDVDRAELRSALNSMDDEQIAINPVLRDFEATLADAATAPEDGLDTDVDRERTITTRTENQLAAAAAQASLGDLGVSLERLPDDVQIDVQADGATETLAGLRTVRSQLADLDDEDARVSVTLDVDRSALDRLSDLNLGLADDAISPDVDTGGERTVDIATDMDVRGTKSHLRAVERALSRVDGRTATAEVDTDMDTDLDRTLHRAAAGLGAVSIPVEYDIDESLRSRLPERPAFSVPVDFDVRERIGERLDLGGVGADVGSQRTIDLTLGDSEQEVLAALSNLRTGLEALPDDERVNIHTRSDLDGLIATMGGVEALPDEVDFDVEAHTAEARAGLSAVLAEARSLDGLSADVEADVDRDGPGALSVLRSGGDDRDFNFDFPDIDGDDRRGSVLGEAVGGFGSLARGAGRGIPGVSGAASALTGMSPAAIAGAGAGAGGLASMAVGGVSALGGAGLGAGGLAGSLALGVSLTTSDREITATKQRIQDELGVLETNADFEFVSDALQSDLPTIVGDVADEVDSISGDLRGTFSEIRGGFWREFPSILSESSTLVTRLDSQLADITVGGLEAAPGAIRELGRAGEQVLPTLMEMGDPAADITGSLSRVGTGGIEFGGAFIEQGLEGLQALTPAADLAGDSLSVAADAASFFMDTLGDPTIEAFGGYVGWSAENARWLGETIYDLGSVVGIWDAMAGGVRLLGSGIEGAADAVGGFFDLLGSGAQQSLELLVDLHNVLNDLPQAQRVPGISAQDIEAPDLSTIGPDRGDGEEGGSGSGTGPGPSAPPPAAAATVESPAVASLPSGGAGPGSSSASPSTSTPATTATVLVVVRRAVREVVAAIHT